LNGVTAGKRGLHVIKKIEKKKEPGGGKFSPGKSLRTKGFSAVKG